MSARFTALLASLGLAACGPSEDTIERAHAMVAEGATLLDVRTPAEYAAGHLEGAVNVPIGELEARIREIPDDRPVVVYCQSGARSARAARLLAERGYEVLDIGGMRNWERRAP